MAEDYPTKARIAGQNDQVFIEAIRNGVLEIDSQGRVWRLKEGVAGSQHGVVRHCPRRRAEIRGNVGYLRLRQYVDGRRVEAVAHRIVWIYMRGQIPAGYDVAHINKQRDDNRPENLELIARVEAPRRYIGVRPVSQQRKKSLSVPRRRTPPSLKNCEVCGVLMQRYRDPRGHMETPSKYTNRRFCSKACHGQSRARTTEGFWADVDKSGDCWIWTGYVDPDGYGRARYQGKPVRAHRLAYMLASGAALSPIQFVCHTCDNPPCVNPGHLFLGDHTANMRDMAAKGRSGAPKGEKVHGAKLTEEDVRLILRAAGGRNVKVKRGFYKGMGARLGVSGRTVRHIVMGNSWNHVNIS